MIPLSMSLAERCAMITGANTGIGQAVAVALAAAGADIIAVGRTEPAETRSAVLDMGRRFLAIQADLSQPQTMSVVVEAALAEFGKVDILVNNAGIIRRNDAVDFSEADWDAVMDVNLKSAFFLTQAVGRRMIEARRGKVINIASMLSLPRANLLSRD
jgi:2-dehydro-3-deoxy-D-gluconate 5-dehydrogenase